VIVADTNLLVALLLPSQLNGEAGRIFQADPAWVLPLLWRSEWRAVLLKLLRARRLELAGALRLAAWAEARFGPGERLPDSGEVLRLASSSGCSAYDCEFVALALALEAPLVTSDREILAAFPAVARSPRDHLVRGPA
jgi:predicted nucleic acid-binding protein